MSSDPPRPNVQTRPDIAKHSLARKPFGKVVMDVKYYSKRILQCANSRNMPKAEEIFVEMERKGVEPNSFTFSAMMRGYYLNRDTNKLFRWYRKMRERNIMATIRTEGMLLASCAASGDLDRASEVLHDFRAMGIEPNTAAMNALIKTCFKAGSLETALRVFQEIDHLNLQKTVASYNTLIEGYVELNPFEDRESLVQKGLEIKRQIIDDGLQCDSYTYNSLIKMCFRVDYTQTAQELFQEMKQMGIRPDVFTYSILIDGYAKHGKYIPKNELLDCCVQLLDEMEARSISPNTHTYNSLLKVCVQVGEYSKAQAIVAEMEERGIEPDIVTYGTLIDCCVKHSYECNPRLYIENCFSYIDDLKKRGLKINDTIISSLLIACATVGDLSAGKDLMRIMEEEKIPLNVIVATSLMKVYLSADDEIGALECLYQMKEKGIQPNVYSYNALIRWYVEEHQKQRAYDTVSAMKRRGIQPNSHTKDLMLKARWL